MTTAEFAKCLITMVAEEHIDDLIDLSSGVSRPLQMEIAKHIQQVAQEEILAKLEVRDDSL